MEQQQQLRDWKSEHLSDIPFMTWTCWKLGQLSDHIKNERVSHAIFVTVSLYSSMWNENWSSETDVLMTWSKINFWVQKKKKTHKTGEPWNSLSFFQSGRLTWCCFLSPHSPSIKLFFISLSGCAYCTSNYCCLASKSLIPRAIKIKRLANEGISSELTCSVVISKGCLTYFCEHIS